MTFYAICQSVGWGRGDTAEAAKQTYYEVQQFNFKHLHRTKAGRLKWLTENAPPVVFEAPAWAEGFVSDGRILWTADGHATEEASADQVIENPYSTGDSDD